MVLIKILVDLCIGRIGEREYYFYFFLCLMFKDVLNPCVIRRLSYGLGSFYRWISCYLILLYSFCLSFIFYYISGYKSTIFFFNDLEVMFGITVRGGGKILVLKSMLFLLSLMSLRSDKVWRREGSCGMPGLFMIE